MTVMSRARTRAARKREFGVYFKANHELYVLLAPAVLYLLLFTYLPLLGNVIAFEDYSLFAGNGILDSIFKSPWVGLKHFARMFSRADSITALRNTIILSLMKIVFLSPIPMFVAILLNEIKRNWLKRTIQTVIIFPHFLSWVIISSIFLTFLGGDGPVNGLIEALSGERIYFFIRKDLFRWLLVFTQGWKETGYGTVIYFAAISGMPMEMFESADIDGAGRWQKIWYLTIPSLSATFFLLLIMRLGNIMDAGFQQVFTMQNDAVVRVSDILGTYIYRRSMGNLEYSFGAAVGVFESCIGFILTLSVNALCRKYLEKSIW